MAKTEAAFAVRVVMADFRLAMKLSDSRKGISSPARELFRLSCRKADRTA
jgi:hypothetical protein